MFEPSSGLEVTAFENALDEVCEDLKSQDHVAGILLFGSRSRNEQSVNSNADLYCFFSSSIRDRDRLKSLNRDGFSFRIEGLPYGLFRNPSLFRGNLKDEVLFSTIEDGLILYDQSGKLSKFVRNIREYQSIFQRKFLIIRLAKLLKYLKLFLSAERKNVDDDAVVAYINLIPVFGKLRLNLLGQYTRREWLRQLRIEDPVFAEKVSVALNLTGRMISMRDVVHDFLTALEKVWHLTSEDLKLIKEYDRSLFELRSDFTFLELDEIEMIQSCLRRQDLSRLVPLK